MQFVYDVSTQYLRYDSLSIPSNSALSFFTTYGTHISLTNTDVYTRRKTQVIPLAIVRLSLLIFKNHCFSLY